jgi:tol-pal system protein YbgF
MRNKVMAGMLMLAAGTFWASSSDALPLASRNAAPPVAFARQAPVILAQAADTEMRVQQLEEQLRQLNGRIEEMSFQLLQMQEQLRKTQEDNEFRFQELEGGKKKSSIEPAPGTETKDTANASGDQPPEATDQQAETLDQPMDEQQANAANDAELGKPAVDLGSITFDENGNVVGAAGENPGAIATENLPPPESANDQPQTAAVDPGSDGAQYQAAYEQVLAGNYSEAEQGFTAFIAAFPESGKAADAHFWLGESQYSQGKFSDAAKTFLNAYKSYGKSAKAPEMLLKLAMSLAALDSTDTACATLREVSKAYPKASRAIISKVASEQKRLAC